MSDSKDDSKKGSNIVSSMASNAGGCLMFGLKAVFFFFLAYLAGVTAAATVIKEMAK